MFLCPTPRSLLLPVLCLSGCIVLLHFTAWQLSLSQGIIERFLLSQVQRGVNIQRESGLYTSIVESASPLYDYDSHVLPNYHIADWSHCPITPNRNTQHIRLTGSILHNISLAPSGHTSDSSLRYFNPTIIPLPSWSPHPYLLISRLVTSGFHQESHICLANVVHSRIGSVPGTETLQCVTQAERLNVPPTPALHCEGTWAAFPDIPGFHDPRVFWSGKGEPLVIVNSGSMYGCVGLWVIDVRSIYPKLTELLRGGSRIATERNLNANECAECENKMSYPLLTEITRNPRSSRSDVEKNWVLFFPRGEESWVMYDLLKRGHEKDEQASSLGTDTMDIQTHLETVSNASHKAPSGAFSEAPPKMNLTAAFDLRSFLNSTHPGSELFRASSTIRSTLIPTNISLDFQNHTYSNSAIGAGYIQDVKHDAIPKRSKRTSKSTAKPDSTPHIQTSRTLAQIVGHGYTTHNLTSPFETACLGPEHVYDSLGNKGQWHQGSNSLRLVLCHRNKMHGVSSTSSSSVRDCLLTDTNEDALVDDGTIVHFMVLHRKFSNELKLPMRYERYFMVWEARFPFRVLGISKHPLLFEGEKVGPWSEEENWSTVGVKRQDEDEMDGDEKWAEVDRNRTGAERTKWQGVYFSYTPSLAWAWGQHSGGSTEESRDLGTGYLDDDVMVGIGMDDVAQGFVKVKASDLLTCLRLCPDFEDRHKGK